MAVTAAQTVGERRFPSPDLFNIQARELLAGKPCFGRGNAHIRDDSGQKALRRART
jgi:hypothetical protein